jgi:ribonuclease Z
MLFALFGVVAATWVASCGAWYVKRRGEEIAALEPRPFARLTAVTIGTGAAYENPRRLGPSVVVGLGARAVLVDAGRGVAESLRRARIPVSQPDTVFLTSLRAENLVGLDDLLLTGWLAPRAQPLRLVGPPGTRALGEALAAAHAGSIAVEAAALGLPEAGARLEALEVETGWQAASGDLSVRAAATAAGELAYRFESGGHAIVVVGAGRGLEALVELAQGADVLVAEGFHSVSVETALELGAGDPERLRREAAQHAPLEEVGALAAQAGVRRLVLSRLRPPPLLDWEYRRIARERFAGEVAVASDGDVFTP